MTKKIRIPYFPKGLRYMAPILFGIGIYLIFEYPIYGISLTIFPIMFVTTHYVTEIDLKGKYCSDYLFFFGFPLKKKSQKFNNLNKVIITKERYSRSVPSRTRSRQMSWTEYTGTLIYDDNARLELLTVTNKKELLGGLKKIVGFMKLKVEDRTSTPYCFIELD